MIIVMKQGASRRDIAAVEAEIRRLGFQPHPIQGVERTVVGAIGDERGNEKLLAIETMDGVMIEVHPNPHEAWSDGAQSLTPERFTALMARLRPVAQAVGREI